MIKTCQQCGAVNGDPSDLCCFCDAPLDGYGPSSISRRVITTDGNLAIESEWRREVSSRLQDYRARRRGGAAVDLQTDLPFEAGPHRRVESPRVAARAAVAPPAPAKKALSARTQRHERFEIPVPESAAVWSARGAGWVAISAPASEAFRAPFYPVASIPERRRAAFVDAGLLLFSYGGMLALFSVLGGHIGFNQVDLAVTGATFALFYAQYFALFTIFGGSTPGMMLRGLRVVSFEGGIPSSRQMAWRSFGYLISAGTCFLGFVWALWDDDQMCWQDRISRTYLTQIEQITPREARKRGSHAASPTE